MTDVIRRNHYDVTDRVFVADPRAVCAEICAILGARQGDARLSAIEQAFEVFSQLYAGTLPGYIGCETWYHDAQHSLDCALVMARLLDGYQRTAGPGEHLREGRAALGVIAALFHDAGYIRMDSDQERHGAEFTLFHVRRSGDFLAAFLPAVGYAEEARMVEQIVHFTGYEVGLDDIQVADTLDRRLGFMLGTADVLAQMSDRCYLEKCRDFLYPEFEICGLAGAAQAGRTQPVYFSREELLRKTPQFCRSLWNERLEGYFGAVYRYAAAHFGGRNLYLEAIEGHLRHLEQVLEAKDGRALRRRAQCINAGPLRVLLGFEQADMAATRRSARPPRYKAPKRAREMDPRAYVPT